MTDIRPTFIDFLLDETGSMSTCYGQTKSGYDNFVKSQNDGVAPCYISLCKFDSSGLRIPYENIEVSMVPSLSFHPNAMTNLYDCIVNRLTARLENLPDGNSLFVIITDGDDNASRSSIRDVRDVIEKANSLGVMMVYLGPENSKKIGIEMGILEENIQTFDTTDMEKTMATVSNSTRAYRSGTAGGFFA